MNFEYCQNPGCKNKKGLPRKLTEKYKQNGYCSVCSRMRGLSPLVADSQQRHSTSSSFHEDNLQQAGLVLIKEESKLKQNKSILLTISKKLQEYNVSDIKEQSNAVTEIIQYYVLAELSKCGFFKEASFHGGTSLKLIHTLDRFSEDLDFALLKPDVNFPLSKYLNNVQERLKDHGLEMDVKHKSKVDNNVKKAFFKTDSLEGQLSTILPIPNTEASTKRINIKIEVDINPPEGAQHKIESIYFPFVSPINCHDLSSCFSEKLHALLCRSYVKGRDWYDLIYYLNLKRKVQFNRDLLTNALYQQGPWKNQVELSLDEIWVVNELTNRINSLDISEAIRDVSRFVSSESLGVIESVWSRDYFKNLLEKLVV